MQLTCPNCSAPVGGDDISPTLQLAHCGSCGHMWEYVDPEVDGIIPPEPEPAGRPNPGLGSSLFDTPLQPKPLVSEELAEEKRPTPVAEKPPAEELDIAVQDLLAGEFFDDTSNRKPVLYKPNLGSAPKGVKVDRGTDQLVLTHRWFTAVYLFLALWCVIWDGAMVGVILSGDMSTMLFTSLHMLAGAAVTYLTLAGFLNRTTISVNRDVFTIRHGPLPWWGNRVMPTRDITQLYCTENAQRTKNGTRYTYDVWAKVGYDEIKILTGFPDAEIAWYIEDSIETFLSITDQPVVLEYNKPRSERGLPILDSSEVASLD